MRHLEKPAGLIQRIGMDKGHHRAGSAHALVIEGALDMVGHRGDTCSRG